MMKLSCPIPELKSVQGPIHGPPSPATVHYSGKSVSDPETRNKLHALANKLGKDIRVTSGDRSEAHQNRLRRQGYRPAKKSQHLFGKAADIQVEGMTPLEVAPIAREVGFKGIGIYSGHLHIDTRESPATWYGQ